MLILHVAVLFVFLMTLNFNIYFRCKIGHSLLYCDICLSEKNILIVPLFACPTYSVRYFFFGLHSCERFI